MLKKLLIFTFSLITIIACARQDPFAGVRKILIIGNSISRHHIRPSIGWTTHWGMAASAKKKDYVHILISELDRLYPETKHEFEIIRLKNEKKMTGTKHLWNKKADLIIIQQGENYRGKVKDHLGKAYENVIKELKERVTKNIICVGSWSLNPSAVKKKASILKKAAHNQGVLFVDISAIAGKQNSAYTDKKFSKASNGVKWHPSDRGMRLIANKILGLSPRFKTHKPAHITVDAGRIIGPVNRKIMGQMKSGADGQYIWSSDKSDVTMRRTGWNIWDPQKNAPESVPTELIKALKPGVVRYPGGSAVKNFNWKATVGPYSVREPNWRWGLMEYLSWCKEINTEPQICLSSYKGTPEDQRDLIEFLNAPAIKKYPWAMKRAEYGHKAPYNVKYIELGNEPNDGNRRAKPGKQWSLDGYIDWALETTRLIREVDPSVKIGLPVWPVNAKDNEKLLRTVGPKVDYIIHHAYSVQYAGNLNPSPEFADRIARSCMAATDQFEYKLKKYNQKNIECIGKELPLGITEYNTSIKSSRPYVYRKSLAAGIFCMDYVFRMMKPENNVLMANYWQIFHGYWGSLSYKNRKLGKIWPPYYCFRIVADHIQDNILAAKVDCPKLIFEGFCAVKPATGDHYSTAKRVDSGNLLKYAESKILNINKKQVEISHDGDLYSIKLKNLRKSHYPNFLWVPINRFPAGVKPSVPGIEYKFSYEAKWIPSGTAKARVTLGLGIMDGRGWSKAGSAIGVDGAESARGNWKTFSGTYKPLKDTFALAVLVRIKGGSSPVNGTFQVKNIKIIPWKSETFPAYDALSLMASRSKDGNTLSLLVINKSIDKSVPTQISLKNFVSANVANVWTVTGPNASADSNVKISRKKSVPVKDNNVKYNFPPHSITAMVFKQHKK
jgi:alpha-L-arabinofuranosidase